MRLRLFGLFSLVTFAGCAATVSRADYLRRSLAPKAAFDLNCPEEQLQFTNLQAAEANSHVYEGSTLVRVPDLAFAQGATGCGKRARYQLIGTGWVVTDADAR